MLHCYKQTHSKYVDKKLREVFLGELGGILEKRDDIALLKSKLSLQPRQVSIK